MNRETMQAPVVTHVTSRGGIATGPTHLMGPQPTSASGMVALHKSVLRASDLEEAIDAVSCIYCPHEVEVRASNRGVNAVLEVIHGGIQPVVGLSTRRR